MPVIVPGEEEQRRIAAVLDVVERSIGLEERQLALTSALKKALMRKLFNEGLRGEPLKETEIGTVPESWEIATIGNILRIRHGYAFKSQYFNSYGSYVLLTPGHFREEGGFRDLGEKTKYYTGHIPDGYILKCGDLLIVMTEQKEGLVGSTLVIPEGEVYIHNQRLGLITDLDETRADPSFLYYLFNWELCT